ncbi:MAG TPA: N-acetyltransferase [Elusimicrobia bacterium]|nr:N-acetyltransferase [Elusimicrobiota bacterium]HBT61872.1 N-acetyltransferase [Elusimicrobiota bacterium]
MAELRYACVRRPGPGVLREIASLYREAGWWKSRDNLARLRRWVGGSHCFLLAKDGGLAVGMGRAISDQASDGYIQDVFVRASHRGQGVGAAIVRRLADRLRADGLGWVGLIAVPRSRRFYERLGFSRMAGHDPMLLRQR